MFSKILSSYIYFPITEKKPTTWSNIKNTPIQWTNSDDYFRVCEPFHKLFETYFATASYFSNQDIQSY